jgi:hypothetical protein
VHVVGVVVAGAHVSRVVEVRSHVCH